MDVWRSKSGKKIYVVISKKASYWCILRAIHINFNQFAACFLHDNQSLGFTEDLWTWTLRASNIWVSNVEDDYQLHGSHARMWWRLPQTILYIQLSKSPIIQWIWCQWKRCAVANGVKDHFAQKMSSGLIMDINMKLGSKYVQIFWAKFEKKRKRWSMVSCFGYEQQTYFDANWMPYLWILASIGMALLNILQMKALTQKVVCLFQTKVV